VSHADVIAAEAARGELPPAPLSTALLQTVGGRVDRLVEASADSRAIESAAVDVEIDLPDGRRLLGSVGGVRGGCALTVTYSRVKAKQRLRAWIELLALTASRPEREVRAVVVGRGSRETVAVVTLGPVPPSDAAQLLAELVAVRDAGLCSVLPLPVAAGAAYAEARNRGTAPTKAFYAARKEWESAFDWPKEDAEPEHVLVWDGVAAFDDVWKAEPACAEPGSGYGTEPTVFARLARRLWQPLLDAEQVRSA
jgi:exodeoxyribonuclease V gamma subunit